jgi:putative N6-adenine-specific DNA methylase
LIYHAVALCAVGAEKVVSNELKKIGDTRILESSFGKVRFASDLAGLYRALFNLRAADRVLLEVASFPAHDFDELFEGTKAVKWSDVIPRGMGLHIGKVRTNRSALKAETSIQASVHKAAAESLCEKYGLKRLPEEWAAKQAELRVYIEKDAASLLLDLSGEPLFKRGYRREGGVAPLRETVAAAVLLLSMWKRKFPLCDPLCGSGTIAIEAALYALNIAPGIGRNFAVNDLCVGDKKLCEKIRRECAEKIDAGNLVRIFGSDADKAACELARANAERALRLPAQAGIRGDDALSNQLQKSLPKFSVTPCEEAKPPVSDFGYLVTNPPWGKRLGTEGATADEKRREAEAGYRKMAALAENFPGWRLAVVCDHAGFESHFGKKADAMRELRSGAVDGYLYEFVKL